MFLVNSRTAALFIPKSPEKTLSKNPTGRLEAGPFSKASPLVPP